MGNLIGKSNINGPNSKDYMMIRKDMNQVLQDWMKNGFNDGFADLSSAGIDDSKVPELCEWIVKLDDKIQILGLELNYFTSKGASMLYNKLKTMDSKIRAVSINSNKEVDDGCMRALGEYIKTNKYIKNIYLNNTQISDTGMEQLVAYFDGNTTLRSFGVLENKEITNKSIPFFIKMIETSCVEYIGINDTSITERSALVVPCACNMIQNGSENLSLGLVLEGNEINSKAASVLFDTLKECKSIVSSLSLFKNKLDDDCMNQLGEYIQNNDYIEHIHIGRNRITDKGVEMLSEYIIGNVTFKELNISQNMKIADDSVPYLVEIAKKSCISKIHVNGTLILDGMLKKIDDSLSIPVDKREIPIKSNSKSAAKIQSASASAST